MQKFFSKIGLKQAVTTLLGTQTVIFFSLALSANEDQSLLFTATGISLAVTIISLLLLHIRLTKPLQQATTAIQIFYSGVLTAAAALLHPAQPN